MLLLPNPPSHSRCQLLLLVPTLQLLLSPQLMWHQGPCLLLWACWGCLGQPIWTPLLKGSTGTECTGEQWWHKSQQRLVTSSESLGSLIPCAFGLTSQQC